MDSRTLIALGMLLSVVVVALLTGTLEQHDVKEIVLVIGGGVLGVALPHRSAAASQKPPIPPAAVGLLLLLGALFLHGCGTTEPFKGPPGPPTLTGDEWFFPHGLDGRWVRETTLHVNNSTTAQLDAVLECESAARHARKWPGSRFTLHVPPMTVQHVLLDPHDHVCSLLPVESDDGE